MDSTAFHELIAQVRDSAATLAEVEKKVAAFKDELARQDRGAQLAASAPQPTCRPIAKRGRSGWVAAG